MQRLRTIPRFVRVLVVLFMAAQFAGVVSSPLALAEENPAAAVSHMHHHDMDAHGDAVKFHSHGDRSANHHADPCCALHAFFAGVLPAVIAVEAADIVSQRLVVGLVDIVSGIDPGRLDRPPRPLVAI